MKSPILLLYSYNEEYPYFYIIFNLKINYKVNKEQLGMLLRHPKDKKHLCNIHKTPVVQLGSCLTCPHKATICEIKGCIGHHQENERAHNVITLEQIRHIVSQYLNSSSEKRAYLKKMVYEYFMVARKEIQRLFTQVYQSIDHFLFDDLLFQEDDRKLINSLVEQNYEEFTCQQVAIIIPKLIKSFDYEDGHFTHLRNYIITQKEKVSSILNTSLLNMPQFRWKNPTQNNYRFHQLYEQTLKELNTKLISLNHKPKKLRLKYIDDEVITLQIRISKDKVLINLMIEMEFVRFLGTLQSLKDVQVMQIYCVWDVDDNEFQLAVVQAILKLPYIRTLAIYTSYTVTSTDFIEDLIEHRNDIEVKVYKKDWMF